MMNRMVKPNRPRPYLTLIVLLLITIYWSFQIFNEARWANGKTIVSDTKSYYTYLPAAFIQKDLTLESLESLTPEEKQYIWTLNKEGKKFVRLPMGVAVCNAPLFAVAHLYASTSDSYRASGYSLPYFLAIHLSALLFGLWGLFMVRKICRCYFDETSTALVLLILAFGTNLTFYVTHYSGYSHVYSFWAIASFIWLTMRWYDTLAEEKKRIKHTVLLGLLSGLITLIRPANCIVGLLFIFWGIENWTGLKQRIVLFRKHWFLMATLICCAFLVVFWQLLYWKIALDLWFYYTYEEQGFYFFNPHFFEVLFSFRKGWLLYTPLGALALIGFYWLWKKQRALFTPIFILSCIHLYLVSCWYSWWFGDSYSQRPMVEALAFLSLPLAAIIQFVNKQRKLLWSATFIAIIAAGIFLNTFQMEQYKKGIIHYDGMTKEAYQATWLSFKFPRNYSELIVQPDLTRMKEGKEEYISSLDVFRQKKLLSKNFNQTRNFKDDPKSGFKLDSITPFAPVFSLPLAGLTSSEKRLRASCTVDLFCEKISSSKQFTYFVSVVAKKGGSTRKTISWPGTLDANVPTFLTRTIDLWGPYETSDSLKITLQYNQGPPIYIDKFTIELLECDYPPH